MIELVGSHIHSEMFALTLRGLSLSWTEWRVRLSLSMLYHAHVLNVRVDLERSAVVLDRMKSTVVSVDAISRARTECSRWPWEVCRCPGQNEEDGCLCRRSITHTHWMFALTVWGPVVAPDRLKNQTWYTRTGALHSAGSGLVENCRLMFHE
jgi:hypothetical protein